MANTMVLTPNYKPTPKQILVHNAPVSYEDIWIILCGGARGGGKSACILADAFMFAQTYPGAKCCILRETLDAVKQSFLDKLPGLFPPEMSGIKIYDYHEKSSSWYPGRSVVFPNGSYITFQRVANINEAKDKQGWEFQYLAIDELTKQTEDTFNYLLTCVRSAQIINKYTGKPLRIPTKVVCGCNPGGVGHKWVKERFIDRTVTKYNETHTPVQTKDLVEFIKHPLKQELTIRRFIRFIPFTALDNPFLNESYVANLDSLTEYQKKMDLYGSWDVVAGKFFDLKPGQRMNPGEVGSILSQLEGHVEIYISIDWGYKPSYHSAHWYAVLPDHRVICFQELYGQELVFEDFVKKIAEMSEDYNIEATCLPHDMFRNGDRYRNDSGKIIGETKSDVFEFYGLNPIGVESGKGKVQMRYDKIQSACTMKNPDGVYKFRICTSCENLIEELDLAVHDDNDPLNIDRKCRDHAIDDFGLFLVFYSDDIEPLGFESLTVEKKSYLQILMEEDERKLEEQEADDYSIDADNYYDDF